MYGSRQQQMGSGLMRYGSAPSSLLASLVDSGGEFSDTGSENLMGRFFSGDSSCLTSESSCRVNVSPDLDEINAGPAARPVGFSGNSEDLKKNQCLAREGGQRSGFCNTEMVFNSQCPETHLENSFGLNQVAVGNFSTASSLKNAGNGSLIRHSSSPAGFFSNLTVENGFSVGGGIGNFNCETSSNCGHGMSTSSLKSQMSFSRQGPLSQVPEISIPDVGESIAGSSPEDGSFGGAGNISQSYITSSFQMGSWEECNPIVFSGDPRKRARDINGEIVHGLKPKDSQFSLPTTSMEMAAVEKVLQINQDYVPCKIRARRGFATHPRSIAERERRTRISEKLRKLQELVPNMDKQTNTADMLDLAVKHIKVLQNQVQKLNQEHANCTCSAKQVA